MAMSWFRKLQPVQLYIILMLTMAFFITELIVSHLTHALTLLMDSYHMLCNILALTGCIITMKVSMLTKFLKNERNTINAYIININYLQFNIFVSALFVNVVWIVKLLWTTSDLNRCDSIARRKLFLYKADNTIIFNVDDMFKLHPIFIW